MKTELIDVICEECSKLSGKITKTNIEKHHPTNANQNISSKIEYNYQRNKYCKNKNKLSLPAQYYI